MKHIVFIIGNYKNGGVAMRATNLANQFAAHGYSVTILATKEIGRDIFFRRDGKVELLSLERYVREHGVEPDIVKDTEARRRKLRRLKRLRRLLGGIHRYDLRLKWRVAGIRRGEELRKYLLRNGGSILICFGYACYEAAAYASEGLRCKLVFAEKNASELECAAEAEEKENVFALLGRADGAVLQTQNEMDFYRECSWRNARVIHNPIKEELPEPYHGLRRDTVVNYCRISRQKNLPLLIEAFERFHAEYPTFTLEIYGNTVSGEEEALLEALRENVRKAGQEAYIRLLPPSAAVHELVKDCAMFVSSSDFEGLSNSMIEAMAIGLPCVCTDCLGGGARELIQDGVNGLLVPVGDADGLYRGMKRMAEDKVLAERCGQNAVKIRDEMAADMIGDQWLRLIERL